VVPVDGRPLGGRVVFHANDWHTGLLPVYLDAHFRAQGRLRAAAVVLGLHNLGHQGSQPAEVYGGLDLAPRWFPTLEMHGRLNPLKAGMVAADALVAVSPTYSRQIQVDHGFGLEPILRLRSERLVGILNGIDGVWDPRTDPHLPAHYGPDDLTGKASCKAALQRELGLPVRPDVPLLAFIGRLDAQKGLDLLEAVAPWLLGHDLQLVTLGSGSSQWEGLLRDLQRTAPSRARARIGFDEPLAHRIEAGADIFLMPSRYEPCGLNQMYSLAYGTIPVVRATGGLDDTIETFDPETGTGNGFKFVKPTAEDLLATARRAIALYRQPDRWRGLVVNAMACDFSWSRSAKEYEALYQEIARRHSARGA
jgi:starch synthase